MHSKSVDNYKQFVCPKCFHQLQECTCRFFPWNLIFIDEKMQAVVRAFNQKGFITTGCCEGHYEDEAGTSIYICFLQDYPEILAAYQRMEKEFAELKVRYVKGKHGLVRMFSRKELDKMGIDKYAQIKKLIISTLSHLLS